MIWLLLPAGALIATIAMLSGIGGGVMWMPLLLHVYELPPGEAVLCALLIQVCGMGSGTVSNLRQGLIDQPLLRQQATVAVPMVLVGAVLARLLEPRYLELVLGLLTFVIAYVFLRGNDLLRAGSHNADLGAGQRLLPVSAIGGVLTGLLSVGIGDWLVPAFNKHCRLLMAGAVATSVALMLLLAVVAASAHLVLGVQAHWQVIAAAAPGVLVGAQIGSRLHRRVSEARFKELFVLLLVFLAAHVTFNAL